MPHDLEDFENEIKKHFSSEMEFLPAKEMQKVINHYGFSLSELRKITRGIAITAVSKAGCLKNSASFLSNAYTTGYDAANNGNKKIRYVYCIDTRSRPTIQYVFSFTQNHESKLLRYLIKIDRLKAFI
jgi:hypothetical protein